MVAQSECCRLDDALDEMLLHMTSTLQLPVFCPLINFRMPNREMRSHGHLKCA